MTESEQTAATTPVSTSTDPVAAQPVLVTESKPNRLYQVAAWVAIIAGSLFIVSTVFWAGFVTGRMVDGPGHHRHGERTMMEGGGPHLGPMMRPGGHGPGGPAFGPGGPGQMPGGPGQMPAGPGQAPDGERPAPPTAPTR